MKNKITLILGLTMLMAFTAIAQENPAPANTQESETLRKRNEVDQRIYQAALRYNDFAVARVKLFELMERNPTNTRYPELLATLYFDAGQYTSAAVSALDLLEVNDKSVAGVEIAAYSLEQLGAMDRALPQFERHYLLTGNLFSLYKTAYMQYSLEKHEEALNSVNMLIKNNKSTEEKVGFPKADNETQEVNLKAAGLNLKAMVHLALKNKTEALEAINQALELQPDFELANETKAEVNKL
ncbi:tetratricopeptide repeat protein [Arthrospiribacter ruber]|uniref:Tetratricopeptide repeat protein n=1 Tax=Arthrospiribacter ruber TaxID=2487934 RepID=A0A951MFH2_9BACT|nr:tetratricopeptide repeat protein [Arthrospiribacter ruber]MBW3468546.1 tetratricopeptide repeat protein [Arthrospiribacter ruber]